MTSQAELNLGRAAAAVAGKIREELLERRRPEGDFLPSVRKLASRHRVGSKTIWRALKALEAEGVIAAEARLGYRVLPAAGGQAPGKAVAYIAGGRPEEWIGTTDRLLGALRESAERRGWSLLAVGSGEQSPAEVIAGLRGAGTLGVALDTCSAEMVEALRSAGLPAVMLNSWVIGAGVDSVMQDGQLGGLLAARHLVASGCRRIAYFGRCEASPHSIDRFSGAAAGLAVAGMELHPDCLVRASRSDAAEKARELLSRKQPPDGIIAPYHGSALVLAETVRAMGLELGREVRMVGWCPEELYEQGWFHPLRGEGEVPPVVTWSVNAMAGCALARLAERRANPEQPELRVKVPAWLRFP